MKRLIWFFLILPIVSLGQDDLLAEIDQEVPDTSEVTAVFKGLKIVNFESTKLVNKNQFTFIVAHRFGSISDGFDTFFGLDDAVTRLNFVFGISDGLNISISRSSFQKIYQAAAKYRLLKQKENGLPISVVGFNEIFINTSYEKTNLPNLEFKHRISYAAQLLISRKFSEMLSFELAPTFFHENYVPNPDQDNSQIALGLGGRYKLGPRWSLNIDYGWHFNRASNSPFVNPLSIGVDLETGGHVFQMHLTNAQPMNTIGYLGQATGDWGDGRIYFGFNLSRNF